MDASGRRPSFGNVHHTSEHLIERFPSADPLADRAIAAIRTVTGRDNVAHTRQTVKRLRLVRPAVDGLVRRISDRRIPIKDLLGTFGVTAIRDDKRLQGGFQQSCDAHPYGWFRRGLIRQRRGFKGERVGHFVGP